MISTIIPTYNREKYIEETILSVYHQDCDDETEIIVVNDGSTDGTGELLEKLKDEIPNLKVITIENQGVSAARNRGLQEAKGDYIQFLDSDDLLAPQKFKLQKKLLEESKDSDFCYCTVGLFKNNSSKIDKIFPGSDKEHNTVLPVFLYATQWTTHAPLYRRSACMAMGDWNHELSRLEDWEYGCRAGVLELKPVFCNEMLAFVREHGEERLSQGDLEGTALALEVASKSILSYMKREDRCTDQWFDIMARHLLSAGRAFALVGNEQGAKRCIQEAKMVSKSKKLSLGISLYMFASNIFGYKNIVDVSKKILGRNMEQRS